MITVNRKICSVILQTCLPFANTLSRLFTHTHRCFEDRKKKKKKVCQIGKTSVAKHQLLLLLLLLLLQYCYSPDDKINVVVGDGDDHVGDVVRSIQVALHGGPAGAAECSGEWAGSSTGG